MTKKMKGDSKIMVKAQRRSSATTAAPKLDITMRTMNGDCSQTAPSQTFNSEYGKSAEEGEITFSVVTFICLKFYVLV